MLPNWQKLCHCRLTVSLQVEIANLSELVEFKECFWYRLKGFNKKIPARLGWNFGIVFLFVSLRYHHPVQVRELPLWAPPESHLDQKFWNPCSCHSL